LIPSCQNQALYEVLITLNAAVSHFAILISRTLQFLTNPRLHKYRYNP
jgi:hypothetical protein